MGTQITQGGNGFGPQVITGDFNGDGKLDLAVTNTADGTVSILLGNGNGTFQPAVDLQHRPRGRQPGLAGRGRLQRRRQARPRRAKGSNSVSILLGNGNGTFGAATTYAAGSLVRGGLAVGDYFGNGRQDIAVAAFGSNTIADPAQQRQRHLRNPRHRRRCPPAFQDIRSIATGDFFGNGHADLAVAGGRRLQQRQFDHLPRRRRPLQERRPRPLHVRRRITSPRPRPTPAAATGRATRSTPST